VKPGGFVLLDDCSPKVQSGDIDVMRAVDEFLGFSPRVQWAVRMCDDWSGIVIIKLN
jgi:hypothetical protein